ncbi:ABC transporter permease [Streptomyces sp. NBRC 109706]|uniref:ABC transporter permease n=1 Tax=Streptomyces sp. NBRC 109706 TaxID=1550035 RepID=UPI000B1E6A90|nr:ABC transporter permease [Streptomyces sp. NBRC 109706]
MESPTVDPPAQGPGTEAEGEDRRARIARYVALFVMPFLMVTMMYATYVGTMHSATPKDMPVAVVGAGPEAEAVVTELNADPQGAVDARQVASEEEALDLLRDRDIAGALRVPDGGGDAATLSIATAAGASQATAVQQVLAPVAAGNGWDVVVEDAAVLPDGDLSGTAVLFAAMGMMLAGYVPLSTMVTSLPFLLSLRRFLPLLLGWSVATSTVIWAVLGPVVGAVDGHYLTFLGIGVLATGAVGLTQVLFTKLLGPLAVLLGMFLWVSLGMPASNLALSIHSMPSFFSFLHGVLPLPAAGEALRSVLYFDGRGLAGHLVTLACWIVAALLLSLLRERRSGHTIPGAPPVTSPGTPLPALAGSPARSLRFRCVTVVAFPLSILVAVVGLMSLSLHKPEVHDLPVVVVGSTAEEADRMVAALEPQLGGTLDLRGGTSVAEETDRLLEQDVVAVYALPEAPGDEATLLTSSAAGAAQQSAVQAMFQQVAAGQEIPLETTDVRPLTGDDTQGSNSLYAGMSWIMAGFLMVTVLRGGAPELTRLRQFLPLLGGWAVGIALWLWFLFDVLIGAINGPAWQLIGFGALTVFCVSLAAGVFTRVFGIAAVVPIVVVLMLAGVPASGGGLSVYMVPNLFQTLQDVLPLPAAVDTVRSLVYFDGFGLTGNLLTILAWGLAGFLLHLVVDRWLTRRAGAPPATDAPGDSPTTNPAAPDERSVSLREAGVTHTG